MLLFISIKIDFDYTMADGGIMVRITVFIDDLDKGSKASSAAMYLCHYLAAGHAQCDLIVAGQDLPRSRYLGAQDMDDKWDDLQRRWLAGDAWLIALGADSCTVGPLADFLHRTLISDDLRRRPFLLLANSRVHERAMRADDLTARLIGAGGVGCAPPLVFCGCSNGAPSNGASWEQLPEDAAQRLRGNADWLVAVTNALQGLQ